MGQPLRKKTRWGRTRVNPGGEDKRPVGCGQGLDQKESLGGGLDGSLTTQVTNKLSISTKSLRPDYNEEGTWPRIESNPETQRKQSLEFV